MRIRKDTDSSLNHSQDESKSMSVDEKSEGDHENERELCARQRQNDGRMEEEESEALRDLHESSSTTFRVNLLETLFLLSLQPAISQNIFVTAEQGTYFIDNAESSHKEAQKNGHEPVNSAMETLITAERILQQGLTKKSDSTCCWPPVLWGSHRTIESGRQSRDQHRMFHPFQQDLFR